MEEGGHLGDIILIPNIDVAMENQKTQI